MLDLARFERGICSCGFHKSLTSDLANGFMPEVEVCNVCKGLAQFLRVQEAEDRREVEAMGDKPNPVTPRAADGRHTSTRMMTADEVERRRASRKAAGQGPR